MAQPYIFYKFDQMSVTLMSNHLTRINMDLAPTILDKVFYTVVIRLQIFYMTIVSKKERKKMTCNKSKNNECK